LLTGRSKSQSLLPTPQHNSNHAAERPRIPWQFLHILLSLLLCSFSLANPFGSGLSVFSKAAFSFPMEQLTLAEFFFDRPQQIAVAAASGAV
jgi:hypothetical protein